MVARSYTTRETKKKVNDTMTARKHKYVYKKRQRRTTVVENDISKDQVINIEEEKDIDWTESEEELGDLHQGLEGPKGPKVQKKDTINGKRNDLASTRKPGLQIKRRKTKKVLTRDQRIYLLQNQKVLNGRVFYSS